MKSKKRKKIIILSVSLTILILGFVSAFGRYIYNVFNSHILEAKGFYFNSSTMGTNGTNHSINNWDGVNPYTITIDLNSRKNDYIKTETDIDYNTTIECSVNVSCEISKTTGVVTSASNADSYTITVTPVGAITTGDTAIIRTSATSNSPYVKTLSTTYEIGVETYNFSYKINDAPGQKYIELELNNAFPYYEVTAAFGSYKKGDHIGVDEYNSLTANQKNNCKSAIITLSFDPNILKLDMLNETYLGRATNKTTTVIGGKNYIKGFKFKMDANMTTKVLFYKEDTTRNYTYAGEGTSIITVSVDTVN